MADLTEVLKTVLSLDARERATVAARLLESLDDLNEKETERLWAEEAQRRLDEVRAGRAKTISSDDVHEQAGRLLA